MSIEQLAKLYQSYISNLENNIQGLNGNSHRKTQAETQITAYKEFVNELGQISAASLPAAPGWVKEWQPMSTAPKDRTIEFINEAGEQYLAVWSDRPVCMLGSRNGGFPPGWSTPIEADTNTNLPLDPGILWREYQPESIPQESREEASLCDYCGYKSPDHEQRCINNATPTASVDSKAVAMVIIDCLDDWREQSKKETISANEFSGLSKAIAATLDYFKLLAGAAEGKGAEATAIEFAEWIVWNDYIPHGLPLRPGQNSLWHKLGKTTTLTTASLMAEYLSNQE